MKKYFRLTAGLILAVGLLATGCTKEAVVETTANVITETQTDISETTEAMMEVVRVDEDTEVYRRTGGGWFYKGIEDDKYIDMDGVKGFTSYTVEAIPETDGFLKYMGTNSEGHHMYDVYNVFNQRCMKLTFVSEEQFYIDDDEEHYYVKWDY